MCVLQASTRASAPVAVDPLRILALEPYYGGSHRAVLDGLASHIDAQWTLLTLPPRKWKWRMRGAAITMAPEARRLSEAGERFDVIFASTFVNLAEFRGLAGCEVARIPAIVYFHENQLVYPNRHSAEWDYQFPLTNITSALSAECCVFNTEWNMRVFLEAVPPFLAQFPDHRPKHVAEKIAAKSQVIHPPFDPTVFDDALGDRGASGAPRGASPRIVWPHRWEHDKDPEAFFNAVTALAAEGLDFEVAIAGQSFDERPAVFERAVELLGRRLVHCDEPESREDYAKLLATSDVAVSTAQNEFFGIAMIEAAYAGCSPLVPDRLAYPELYPAQMRYGGSDELLARLRSLVLERPTPGMARGIAESFTFERLAPEFSALFERLAH